jgi:hypothetical protein
MQVIGIFAVVASLIFVGLQMKQEQDIAIASQYQERAQATMEMYLTLVQVHQGSSDDDAGLYSQLSAPQRTAMINWGLTAFDNHHFQYTSGYLAKDAWDGLVRLFTPMLQDCVPRNIYEGSKHKFRPDFVSFIEASIGDCKVNVGLSAETE